VPCGHTVIYFLYLILKLYNQNILY
jgi:hypothetical protein